MFIATSIYEFNLSSWEYYCRNDFIIRFESSGKTVQFLFWSLYIYKLNIITYILCIFIGTKS